VIGLRSASLDQEGRECPTGKPVSSRVTVAGIHDAVSQPRTKDGRLIWRGDARGRTFIPFAHIGMLDEDGFLEDPDRKKIMSFQGVSCVPVMSKRIIWTTPRCQDVDGDRPTAWTKWGEAVLRWSCHKKRIRRRSHEAIRVMVQCAPMPKTNKRLIGDELRDDFRRQSLG